MATLPTVECSKCGRRGPPMERNCRTCQNDLGFPNVLHAAWKEEISALTARHGASVADAVSRGCESQLATFEHSVARSSAVLALSLGALHSLLVSDRTTYQPHHIRVRSGGLFPKNDEWDPYRLAAEATIHPFYYDRLHYAALSLDGIGLKAYGDYFVTLKEPLIEDRTTVFEMNPFKFNEDHGIVAGQPPPLGYRAVWASRAILATAKLCEQIYVHTVPADHAGILLRSGPSTGDGDWIEALVYGDFDARTISRVIGPKPTRPQDGFLWDECTQTAGNLGILVEERS